MEKFESGIRNKHPESVTLNLIILALLVPRYTIHILEITLAHINV
jgi:hypothetical protein